MVSIFDLAIVAFCIARAGCRDIVRYDGERECMLGSRECVLFTFQASDVELNMHISWPLYDSLKLYPHAKQAH